MKEGPFGYKFHGGGDTPPFMRAYEKELREEAKPKKKPIEGDEKGCLAVGCLFVLGMAALIALAVFLLGCSSDSLHDECEHGAKRSCECTVGYRGLQTCHHGYWSPCACETPSKVRRRGLNALCSQILLYP